MIKSQLFQLGESLHQQIQKLLGEPKHKDLFVSKLFTHNELEDTMGGLALCVSFNNHTGFNPGAERAVQSVVFELRLSDGSYSCSAEHRRVVKLGILPDGRVNLAYLLAANSGPYVRRGEYSFQTSGGIGYDLARDILEAVLGYLLRLQPNERAALMDYEFLYGDRLRLPKFEE